MLTQLIYSEGIITVLVAFASFWVIQDFPDTAKFLTEPERAVVIARLQSDDQFSAAGEGFQWKNVWASLLDWRTWCGMIMYMYVLLLLSGLVYL